MNSCNKGKVGEREWRDVLRAAGYLDARRGRQFSGSPESPDVMCESLEFIHFEVKRTESLSVYEAMAQAVDDSGSLKTPVVAHRRNNKEWLCILRAEDFLRILRHEAMIYRMRQMRDEQKEKLKNEKK